MVPQETSVTTKSVMGEDTQPTTIHYPLKIKIIELQKQSNPRKQKMKLYDLWGATA